MVTLNGQKDFADVIKVSNQLALRERIIWEDLTQSHKPFNYGSRDQKQREVSEI